MDHPPENYLTDDSLRLNYCQWVMESLRRLLAGGKCRRGECDWLGRKLGVSRQTVWNWVQQARHQQVPRRRSAAEPFKASRREFLAGLTAYLLGLNVLRCMPQCADGHVPLHVPVHVGPASR
jgi:hypothetical protein